MDEMLLNKLFEELKEEFPEFSKSIKSIGFKVEYFSQLVQEYHQCKQEILLLEKQDKPDLLQQYHLTLVELKREILDFFAKNDHPQID